MLSTLRLDKGWVEPISSSKLMLKSTACKRFVDRANSNASLGTPVIDGTDEEGVVEDIMELPDVVEDIMELPDVELAPVPQLANTRRNKLCLINEDDFIIVPNFQGNNSTLSR